ncbi:MAG: hypothetical protein GY765_03920 [bacterium]|nr:hypothetical protein [bacterium]
MKSTNEYLVIKKMLVVLPAVLLLLLSGCVAPYYVPVKTGLPGMENVRTFYVHQDSISIFDEYVIKNADAKPVYHVKGKFISVGNKLRLRDMEGNELAYIKEKVYALNLRPHYKIYRDGRLIAEIRKYLHLYKNSFRVKVIGGPTYQVKGQLRENYYRFRRDGMDVAFVSKRHIVVTDDYRVEIGPEEDDLIILAAAIVIDEVCHEKKGSLTILKDDDDDD